jgi:hypothetical protein
MLETAESCLSDRFNMIQRRRFEAATHSFESCNLCAGLQIGDKHAAFFLVEDGEEPLAIVGDLCRAACIYRSKRPPLLERGFRFYSALRRRCCHAHTKLCDEGSRLVAMIGRSDPRVSLTQRDIEHCPCLLVTRVSLAVRPYPEHRHHTFLLLMSSTVPTTGKQLKPALAGASPCIATSLSSADKLSCPGAKQKQRCASILAIATDPGLSIVRATERVSRRCCTSVSLVCLRR